VASVDDISLIHRVMESYKQSFGEHAPSDSFWDRGIVTLNAGVHGALMGTDGEKAGRLLRNPAESTFFWPNPFPSELGLQSRRGVIGFRAIQALYQAWRIAQIAGGKPDFKVMEIGAGLGRTAYFATLFGLKRYTIIDVPLSERPRDEVPVLGAQTLRRRIHNLVNGMRL
jgi:hypothetical protein